MFEKYICAHKSVKDVNFNEKHFNLYDTGLILSNKFTNRFEKTSMLFSQKILNMDENTVKKLNKNHFKHKNIAFKLKAKDDRYSETIGEKKISMFSTIFGTKRKPSKYVLKFSILDSIINGKSLYSKMITITDKDSEKIKDHFLVEFDDINIDLKKTLIMTNTYKIDDKKECIDGELWKINGKKKINIGSCDYKIVQEEL